MGASFQLEFYSWEQIMIAKITLVSMLAAVALARPEADPYFYHHGVVGHVHPTCEQGVDTLEVQTCAPRVEQVCVKEDVMSEEITYERGAKMSSARLAALSLSSVLLRLNPRPRLKPILNSGVVMDIIMVMLAL